MPAQLLALTEGPNILLDKPILLFGRHPECDIQIESRKISRRHCCVAQVGDYLVVRDLGSTNGIRINGVRVLEGKLRAGDELTIGNHRYQIRWDALGAPSVPRPAAGKAAPVKPSPPPARPRHIDDDDDLLEECDEPVPLEEPAQLPPKRPVKVTAFDNDLMESEEDNDSIQLPEPPKKAEEPPSLVVPYDLELAPVSDVITPDKRKSEAKE